MKNKILSIVILCVAFSLPAIADTSDTDELLKLEVAARIDYQFDSRSGHTDNSETGFRGKYLVIRADGQIVKGLTYSWRQRLNKLHEDQSFFDATDWVI